ncbi:hypothetical protein BZG36_01735 [Bifiguratus adelaidae]|uniref:chitin synthase n=1 Tax=Bifiguratus adelaidae TaxID=1938954 RepID=A0A261Y2X1_9FUNG|nr:hypothetical protein BZG36_01735 [Bifiguratus adelaidae]
MSFARNHGPHGTVDQLNISPLSQVDAMHDDDDRNEGLQSSKDNDIKHKAESERDGSKTHRDTNGMHDLNIGIYPETTISTATAISRRSSLTPLEKQRPRQSGNIREPDQMAELRNMVHGAPLRPKQRSKKAPLIGPSPDHSAWELFAQIATFCCFPWLLSTCCGKKDALTQQAFREKLTLCYIIVFFWAVLAFVTFGLQRVLCSVQRVAYPFTTQSTNPPFQLQRTWRGNTVTVYGNVYPFAPVQQYLAKQNINLTEEYQNEDISALFDGDSEANSCVYVDRNYPRGQGTLRYPCIVKGPYGGSISKPDNSCLPLTDLQEFYKSDAWVTFEWSDLLPNAINGFHESAPLLVYGDTVLNISDYIASNEEFFGEATDTALLSSQGNDGSYLLSELPETKQAIACIQARYTAGVIASETMGCFAAQAIMYLTLIVIIGLIIVRFTMALTFQWFIAGRLVRKRGRHQLVQLPMPSNVLNSNNTQSMSKTVADQFQHIESSASLPSSFGSSRLFSSSKSDSSGQFNSGAIVDPLTDPTKLYTLMMVTCYSEGKASLFTTLDSLAETTYSDKYKIFFIIADGLITGSGETMSTPDICISMLDIDPQYADPQPCRYIAIADGEKRLNMAKVYAGHYVHKNARIPAILIVKCGTDEERRTAQKPGNRGKRDSQLILMSFYQRILFNDRLTELDFEIFTKIRHIMGGVNPDNFELVLLVDADTKVMPESLSAMVAAMVNDTSIMGLCGETRIANKRSSWVTAIQVFEYYISHHYAKAFESVFGGVTCLPGCFCLYRLKAPKNGGWVPLLANPDIVIEYNQNVVTTLHAKNLLLLGEDRFLSTLMLRTFPKRQMVFLPQAICKTVVPDTFSVLLSQRRRWINSTVHNLMELVLVSDLCGIACLSMQFAVLMELIGTVVLPAAITFTAYLIVQTIILQSPQWVPLLQLAVMIGGPALLIVITTRKIVYIGWMFIYLCALPIWNFVLPIYAFWHFDDFTWGATRKVAGEKAPTAHGEKEGEFDSSQIIMKKWDEWEWERIALSRGYKAPYRRSPAPSGSRGAMYRGHGGGAIAITSSSPSTPVSQVRSHYDAGVMNARASTSSGSTQNSTLHDDRKPSTASSSSFFTGQSHYQPPMSPSQHSSIYIPEDARHGSGTSSPAMLLAPSPLTAISHTMQRNFSGSVALPAQPAAFLSPSKAKQPKRRRSFERNLDRPFHTLPANRSQPHLPMDQGRFKAKTEAFQHKSIK